MLYLQNKRAVLENDWPQIVCMRAAQSSGSVCAHMNEIWRREESKLGKQGCFFIV